MRTVYVISDLHLGGRAPDPDVGDRGFRMMRRPEHLARFVRLLAEKPVGSSRIELVINGDFVDFLAEQLPENGERWVPFLSVPGDALRVFDQVLDRKCDREVFDALGSLLKAGHNLTVMLGNHDLELALPEVRSRFEDVVGAQQHPGHLRWIVNNEAYLVGNALIEHGNRYDPANVVDHDRLRELCSLRSRWMFEDEARVNFAPPPGSRFVAEFMNPLKAELSFVDLLKPESEPLFALVLALKPEMRDRILAILAFLRNVSKNTYAGPATPGERERIAAVVESAEDTSNAAVAPLLDSLALPPNEHAALTAELLAAPSTGERARIASLGSHVSAAGALTGLLTASPWLSLHGRLTLARYAMRVLGGDGTFDRTVETNGRTFAAASALAAPRAEEDLGTMPTVIGRLRYVVFGHTHHAKRVPLKNGATYLNTGTWAELMRFPEAILDPSDEKALTALEGFSARVDANELDGLTEFTPTYVRLDIGENTHGELYDYDWKAGRLTDPA